MIGIPFFYDGFMKYKMSRQELNATRRSAEEEKSLAAMQGTPTLHVQFEDVELEKRVTEVV